MSTGLLIVYTGDKKGGSAAVLGQAFRALGRGLRVCIINCAPEMRISQDLVWPDGVQGFLEVHDLNESATPDCREVPGQGDAEFGLRLVKDALTSGRFDMVVLNEIADWSSAAPDNAEALIDLLLSRPEGLHLLVAGQDVPHEILAAADLVTEARAFAPLTR